MYTGSLGAVSNREDWILSAALFDDTNTPFSIAGAAISVFVTDPDTPSNAIISGSVADGSVAISGDGLSFTWTFIATTMGKLCAGDYSVFTRMVLNGSTSQLISAGVSIVEGGPTS